MGKPIKATMEDTINRCPDHLYTYSPQGTAKDRRWAFQLRTCLSLDEAYEYAMAYPQRADVVQAD